MKFVLCPWDWDVIFETPFLREATLMRVKDAIASFKKEQILVRTLSCSIEHSVFNTCISKKTIL